MRGEARDVVVVAIVEGFGHARVGVGGEHVQPSLVARDDRRDIVVPGDLRAHLHEVAHGLSARARDSLGERAAVGVRVDRDDAVIARVGQRHAEERRDGGLAHPALARENGYEARAPGERRRDATIELFARTSALAVTEVDAMPRDRIHEVLPGALGLRAHDLVRVEQAVGRQQVGGLAPRLELAESLGGHVHVGPRDDALDGSRGVRALLDLGVLRFPAGAGNRTGRRLVLDGILAITGTSSTTEASSITAGILDH